MERISSCPQSPLLSPSNDYAEDGSVDLHGRPVSRSLTGGWRASLLIIGVEVAERLAYYGIQSNLITYLTNVLHEATATAAKNVNIWSGVATVLPLVGGFVADSYLGRYWTIVVSSLVYMLGLISLTLSAALPFLRPPPCHNDTSNYCSKASPFHMGVFFFSLYLVALGQGGHKPCLQAFGADQFDAEDPRERKYRSSFFNWWFFGMCIGILVAVSVLMYVQDDVGWGMGFGIPAVTMAVALSIFLCGTRFYRHKLPAVSPLTQMMEVIVAAFRKRNVSVPQNTLYATQTGLKRQLMPTNQFKFLDKAAVEDDLDYRRKTAEGWKLCTVSQVEEVKLVLRVIPIWIACLMYGVVCSQPPTFFTKQGGTMDRKIGAHFKIPPAAMQTFISLSIFVLTPLYERVFVPVARNLTGNERGITLLQRIGTGMFISILSMIVAAFIEIKRLQISKDNRLVDMPHATIPLSIFWLFPQYILCGMSEVFTLVGLQEYFYDQVPDSMRSLGLAVYLSAFGVGSFLSSFLISIIEQLSSKGKGQSWFAENLNKAHLDYYYWLLAALSALNLCIYMSFASRYIYKKIETNISCDEETPR